MIRRATQQYLVDPDPKIGGATIPILGMPGSGKSVALTVLAGKHESKDHIILWRGTKQAQWTHFLANDRKVTLWNHESLEDFQPVITGSAQEDIPEKQVHIEEKGVEINQWSEPDELIERIAEYPDSINVVNVPGLQGDDATTDYHMYFFRQTWINIFDAIIERSYGDFMTAIVDEIGDIFPSQQQLRKPFYRIVRQLPPKLAQLRKNNCFLFGAAHSTHDVHYYFWKIKSNSVAYMSGANVKKELSPSVEQKGVNSLDRGHVLMPGPDKHKFGLPSLMEDLEWIPDDPKRKFRLRWTSNAPDWLGETDDGEEQIPVQEVKQNMKKKYTKKLLQWRDEEKLDWGQRKMSDFIGVTQSTVSRWGREDKADAVAD